MAMANRSSQLFMVDHKTEYAHALVIFDHEAYALVILELAREHHSTEPKFTGHRGVRGQRHGLRPPTATGGCAGAAAEYALDHWCICHSNVYGVCDHMLHVCISG
jgi:hypothetical protein